MEQKNTTAEFDFQPADLANDLIRLQPLTIDDFEQLYSVASDPLIWEQHPEPDRYKREVFKRFFDEAVRSGSAFLVFDNSSGKLIGSSRYYNYEKDSVAIGYTFLVRAFWGGRYNSALKSLMLQHAFRYVNRVLFHVGANNIRSQKAVLKLGAQKIREFIPENDPNRLNYEYLLTRKQYETPENEYGRLI